MRVLDTFFYCIPMLADCVTLAWYSISFDEQPYSELCITFGIV